MKKIIVLLVIFLGLKIGNTKEIHLTERNILSILNERNVDILNSVENIKLVFYKIKEVKSGVFPNLKLESAYARQNYYDITQKQDYSLKLSLVQPLYTYGKLDSAIKIAKEVYKNSELELKLLKKDIKLKTLELFYSIKLLLNQKSILISSKESLKEHLENIKIRYESNDVIKLDLLTAQVNYKKIEPQIIEINSKIDNLKNKLKVLLNEPIETIIKINKNIRSADLPINSKDIQPVYLLIKDKRILFNKGIKNSEILKIYTKIIEINKLNYKINKNTLRPDLNFVVSYSANSEAISDVLNRDNQYAGIQLTFPLFDGFESKSKMKQNLIEISKLKKNIEKEKLNIKVSIQEQINNLKIYEEQIKVNKLLVEQSGEALRVAKLNYKLGNADNTRVIDAEKDYVSSEIALVLSYYNQKIAILNLNRLVGEN